MNFFLICYVLLMAGARPCPGASAIPASGQRCRPRGKTMSASPRVGIEPFQIRLAAFILSGMITGVAGALYADLNRFVSPSMISWQMSGELIVLIILGGAGRLFGPVAGAMLFVLLEFSLGGLTERWQLFLGLILLGVVLFARGGIIGLLVGKARHG